MFLPLIRYKTIGPYININFYDTDEERTTTNAAENETIPAVSTPEKYRGNA